jgi:hypothetical protein
MRRVRTRTVRPSRSVQRATANKKEQLSLPFNLTCRSFRPACVLRCGRCRALCFVTGPVLAALRIDVAIDELDHRDRR